MHSLFCYNLLGCLYELMNIKWMCFREVCVSVCLGNEWGRAQICEVSRARVHGSIITRSIFRPPDISSFHLIFTSRTKNCVYYRVVSGYSALLDQREDICAAGLSVLMENGELCSRVSAAADGDFQRIVDRSGRAHIPTALHVRNHFHGITRKKPFPRHYT